MSISSLRVWSRSTYISATVRNVAHLVVCTFLLSCVGAYLIFDMRVFQLTTALGSIIVSAAALTPESVMIFPPDLFIVLLGWLLIIFLDSLSPPRDGVWLFPIRQE